MKSSSRSTGNRLVRILVLTFYYPPDLSACSFRVAALVRALVQGLPPGAQVEVITTLPNRYRTFSVDVPPLVREGSLTIRRIGLPPHESGMVDQMRAFVVFARAVGRLVDKADYSLVFATSSRLMTAVLGSWIARRKKALLYLDIRDIFVDTISDILPRKVATPIKPFLSLLERFAVDRAAKVNLVSEGFAGYFRSRYPRQHYSFLTNGADDEFVGICTEQSGSRRVGGSAAVSGTSRLVTVVYAGNMGEGQGLHAVVPELAKRLRGRARFRLIGDGGRRRELEARIAAEMIDNVDLLPPMGRHDLIEEYRRADILFLHLNDHVAFKKVLPSKIFEYAATGKPLWAGVAGYAADFLREYVENVGLFPPCDASAGVQAFTQLDLACRSRTEFARKFSRGAISAKLAADILGVLDQNA